MQNVIRRPKVRREGPTAFVLNVSLAGLGAVRSLGRAGVPVIGLDPDPGHAGLRPVTARPNDALTLFMSRTISLSSCWTRAGNWTSRGSSLPPPTASCSSCLATETYYVSTSVSVFHRPT